MKDTIRRLLTSIGFVERWLNQYSAKRLVRRLAQMDTYEFSQDYTSNRASLWEQHLSHYKAQPTHMLEIGSFEGKSSVWFLENILVHDDSTITCIDAFTRWRGEPRFDHNIRVSGFADKVTTIKEFSYQALPRLTPASFDIIYIDGSHHAANVLMDAVFSWFLLKDGGVIIFDDYEWQPDRPPQTRPQMAIDAFIKLQGTRLEILHQGYQVFVRKAPAA